MRKHASAKLRTAIETPTPVPLWERRGTLLLAAALLFVFVFFAYAGSAWASALYRLLTDGSFALLWLAAMLGAGRWLAKPFGVSRQNSSFATSAALGIGAFSLLLLILGWAGVLNRGLAWVLVTTSIAAGIVDLAGDPRLTLPALSAKLQERVEWTSWLWLIVIPFLAIAVLGAMVPPGMLWGDEPHGFDVIEYHLQIPREWYEAGRIVPLHHNVFSYFPFNVEMHYLLAMHLRGGPWEGMYLAQLMHVTMVVLAVVALAGFVRRTNPGKEGLIAILLAASTPWLTLLAPVAYNEGGLLLFGTLALGWTLQAMSNPERRLRWMALAGVMAGLACGVKLTAVPMLLAGIPVATIAATLLRRERICLRSIASFVLCGSLAFSPWLLRNFIWTHNPVFPEAMSLFGRAHFSPEQAERWRLAYVPPPAQRAVHARLAAAWGQILGDWRYGFVILPAGLFAFVRGKMCRQTLFLLAIFLIWFVFWLFFTHLQSRFFVLAIPVAALLLSRLTATPIGRLTLICGLFLQALIALLNLHLKLTTPATARGPAPLDDYLRKVVNDDIYLPLDVAGSDLCLVGDARPFVCVMPMYRLHYRTVFDVDVRGRSTVEAWIDGFPPVSIKVIDYDEIRRYAWKEKQGTGYWGIPAPPADKVGREIIPVDK